MLYFQRLCFNQANSAGGDRETLTMEQLLEEFDSLQQQDLAQLTGNWCESCESLRQVTTS